MPHAAATTANRTRKTRPQSLKPETRNLILHFRRLPEHRLAKSSLSRRALAETIRYQNSIIAYGVLPDTRRILASNRLPR